MDSGPLQEQPLLSSRQSTGQDVEWWQLKPNFIVTVSRVEVRRSVVSCVDPHDDPGEVAEVGHGAPVTA